MLLQLYWRHQNHVIIILSRIRKYKFDKNQTKKIVCTRNLKSNSILFFDFIQHCESNYISNLLFIEQNGSMGDQL